MTTLKTPSDTADTSLRIAFGITSMRSGPYWQPVLMQIAQLFPQTIVFTSCWSGFIPGYEQTFQFRATRTSTKSVMISRDAPDDNSSFRRVKPYLLWELVRFHPDVIFVPGFSVFTLCGLAVKMFVGSRLVLLWEGISPRRTFLDCPLRLKSRRIIARFADAAISNTRDGMEYLRDVIGIPGCKIVHHPFEVAEIGAMESGPAYADNLSPRISPTFLFVGQLTERKGVHELLQACSLLVKEGVECFSVVIAGTGACEQELHHEASTLGLDHIVHWVGAVNYESLGRYYRSSDVFVFPTLDDIFGVVLLEAMSFGKPILCSRYAGSKELAEHGSNGFVCDPLNCQELADYMERFIREPGLILKFGARSKELISRFTPRCAANVLATLVRKVLD
jgi:glycosyltransferase involved in cell wall biosynthesis